MTTETAIHVDSVEHGDDHITVRLVRVAQYPGTITQEAIGELEMTPAGRDELIVALLQPGAMPAGATQRPSVASRCAAHLATLPGRDDGQPPTITTAALAAAVRAPLSAVSAVMHEAESLGQVHRTGYGTWTLGPQAETYLAALRERIRQVHTEVLARAATAAATDQQASTAPQIELVIDQPRVLAQHPELLRTVEVIARLAGKTAVVVNLVGARDPGNPLVDWYAGSVLLRRQATTPGTNVRLQAGQLA